MALESLNNDFCYFLDHNRVDDLVDLFTQDAIYTHGARRSEGREAIRSVFTSRTSDGARTARHMQTGLRLRITSETTAEGYSVCMTFAQNGVAPIPTALPYLVADFIDQYQLGTDGKWRISKRHIERIFVAEHNSGPVGLTK